MADRQLLSSILNKPLTLVTGQHFQPGYLGLVDTSGYCVAIVKAEDLFDGDDENHFVEDV